jgi:hypothetical protein
MEESFDELADESRISAGELMREISNARPACGDLPLRRARFGNSGGRVCFLRLFDARLACRSN